MRSEAQCPASARYLYADDALRRIKAGCVVQNGTQAQRLDELGGQPGG